MASVNIWLNEKYKKKDGTCAVYASVYVHRQKVKFNTGVSVKPENWNEEKRRVKGNGKKVKDDNLFYCINLPQCTIDSFSCDSISSCEEAILVMWSLS